MATHPREGIDLDALAQAIVRLPRACWLMTTFQNPLGSLMPDAKKEALVVADHGVALIEDDVYGELYFGDKRPRPAKAFDREGIVMHCSSFSKTLALATGSAGRRRPLHAPHHAQQAHHQPGHRRAHSRPPSPPTWRKAASIATCASSASSWPCNRARCCRPWRGIFPRAPVPRVRRAATSSVELLERIDTLQLHRAALGHGISIAPGPLFSATGGFGNFLRLNYGHPWNGGLEQGMATLGKLMGG